MFISNSQKNQLINAIKSKCLNNEIIAREAVDNVISVCEERSLDFQKVSSELASIVRTTAEIKNMPYFAKAVVERLDINVFRLKTEHLATLPLHQAFKDFHFTGEGWELYFIDNIEEYAVNTLHVDIDALIRTNRAIVVYCVQNDYLTLKEFRDFLLKSKVLKGKEIPLKDLEKAAVESNQNHEEIIKDLEGDLYGKN